MKHQASREHRKRIIAAPSSLYLIASQGVESRALFLHRVREAIGGGVALVQMREKSMAPSARLELAQDLLAVCRELDVLLIINDDAELARNVGADGLHVGQDDLAPAEARAIIGDAMLLGQSTHDLTQVERAMNDDDVDMLGFGPIFATTTKDAGAPRGCPLLAEVVHRFPYKPVWAIGGIGLGNLAQVAETGCSRVAVSSALMKAGDPRADAFTLTSGLSVS